MLRVAFAIVVLPAATEKLRFLTSYPPKQLLAVTIEDTRYTLHLVRTDLDAKAVPAN